VKRLRAVVGSRVLGLVVAWWLELQQWRLEQQLVVLLTHHVFASPLHPSQPSTLLPFLAFPSLISLFVP
jgi:hypothetical protein